MKQLRVWCGPMGSAKTTGALHAIRRYERLGHTCILIRPKVSIRSHEQYGRLVTKNKETYPSIDLEDTSDIIRYANSRDVVWVDEPFLFKDESLIFSILTTIRSKSVVLVSTLGADALLSPFGTSVPKLIAAADEINWCLADCDSCGSLNTASRTLACVPVETGKTKVGGVESYSAVCVDCWNLLMQYPPETRRDKFKRGQT